MKTYKFKINGNPYEVAVNGIEGKTASVTVNGVDYQVELENAPAAPQPSPAAAPQPAAQQAPQPTAAAPAPAGGATVASPLPGVVISVNVKEGDPVKRGQKVAVIEAMKMENDILAEVDGTITKVHVSKGDSILEGAAIVTIG